MKLALFGLFGLLSTACATTTPPDSQANLRALRDEHTTVKLVQRGLGYAELGDLTRAEQYLAAALEQGATPRQALPRLLHVCIAAGRHRAALVYAQEYGAPLASDAQFLFLQATLESAVGDADTAIEQLRRTVKLLPDHPNAHYQLALLLERREGSEADIVAHLRHYLRLAPHGSHADDAWARLNEHCSLDDCRSPAAEFPRPIGPVSKM